MMRRGLRQAGAPEDLIQIIREPSIPATNELMKQVDLVLATGGGAMVQAAYSSGTPSYGVGPGNAVQIVAGGCRCRRRRGENHLEQVLR
jgi:sulfoacetaldehyde dehydrogenase